ncbi:hypothetical protein C8J57DRAFT_1445391 [Mycena rebaudengoi]|nr:hypothetical protein C8J57DRAFT_1445391 [Mycena rebaudengoi]
MFHGRRNILDKMHAYFSQEVGKRHVCLLHGLGGAGKTQICLKFLDETDKSRSLDRFTDVFFLDASTIDTIKSGLKNIALTQSIGSEDDDTPRWLASRHDEWLLIFDNADDPHINLFNYFPPSSCGNILITSRNPHLHVHAPDSHHHISDMGEEDAALYCFPLAVVQAGAFIARTGKLRTYLTLYEQNRTQLLSKLPAQSHDKYAWSVYNTWDISFNCLGPLPAKFLQICSFLHHEGISEAIFSNAANYKWHSLGPTEDQIKQPHEFLDKLLTQSGTWDQLHFTEIITEIRGYSLINQNPNTNLFSIHPLVHDWSRKTITDTNATRECSATILAMSTMSNFNDKVFLISLLPHLNSVLHGEPQAANKFLYAYGRVYYDSGHFQRAQELCVALVADLKRILGSEHPETLIAMGNLAVMYHDIGHLTDAEELKVMVLEKMKQILGTEHPDTLAGMSNLAATYWKLGKLTDAMELDVAVFEKRKQILGTEHPDTLAAMSSLAITYHDLGSLAEAEKLKLVLEKLANAEELQVMVFEKRKQILGAEHPDTLRAMLSLAITYHNLGNLAEAEELKLMVLDKRKQILGPEHPDTVNAMSSLAATYRELGKLAEAEHLALTVFEKKASALGPGHEETKQAQENLSEIQ